MRLNLHCTSPYLPANEHLWLAAVRQEKAAGEGGEKAAEALMAKALQECPGSGTLWAEAVQMAPRPQRKSKSVDALRRCDNDPRIIASIANLFWQDRKVKTRAQEEVQAEQHIRLTPPCVLKALGLQLLEI